VKNFYSIAAVLILLCLSSAAMADVVIIATSTDIVDGNGEFIGEPTGKDGLLRARSETDMTVDVSYTSQFNNEFMPLWVTSLAIGMNGGLIAGNSHAQSAVYNSWNFSVCRTQGSKITFAAYSGISAISTRPNGDIVIGTMHDWSPNGPEADATSWWPGRVLVLDGTNLTLKAADYNSPSAPDTTGHFYVGTLGQLCRTNVTALATMSNDYVVIGDSNGIVYVRSGTDLYSSKYVPDTVNFGADVSVNALAVVPKEPNNLVVIAYGNAGDVTVRVPDGNLAVSSSNVNFGSKVTAMVTLPNDRVAIGLANGQVVVRDPNTNIAADLGISAAFDSGITAMAVGSSGHIVIGTNGGRVYIRSQDNLNVIPAGVGLGAEGYIQLASPYSVVGAPYGRITALAVYSPDAIPANCAEARQGGYVLGGDYNGDCYVNLKDAAVFALRWLNRCGYNVYNSTRKQVEMFCGDPAVHGAVVDITGTNRQGIDQNKSYVKFDDFDKFTEYWLECTDPLNAGCEHAWE
jgi:hypothetical protein